MADEQTFKVGYKVRHIQASYGVGIVRGFNAKGDVIVQWNKNNYILAHPPAALKFASVLTKQIEECLNQKQVRL